MKFTGLILICATSCLALILPAIGVVQFPKSQESRTASVSTTLLQGFPVMTQGGMSTAQTTQTWTPGLPINGQPASPFPVATMPPVSSPMDVAGQLNGSPQVDGSAPPTTKFGLGIWLLLAPVCLIGLAMWTFSPNPSSSKLRV